MKHHGDYQKGLIYRCVNDQDNTAYYGSSINYRARKALHKHLGKTGDHPLYTAMRKIGPEHFRFEVIEQYPCKNRKELEAREYAILAEACQRGTPVYNQKKSASEKKSEATKLAISRAKTGVATKCGHLRVSNGSYVFVWREDKKTMTRSFSCKKYGSLLAKKKAWDLRQSIYPEWSPDPEDEALTLLCLLALE